MMRWWNPGPVAKGAGAMVLALVGFFTIRAIFSYHIFLGIVVVGAGLFGIHLWTQHREKVQAREAEEAFIAEVYERVHREMRRFRIALISVRRQTLKTDEFGIVDDRAWRKRIDDFLWKKVFPDLADTDAPGSGLGVALVDEVERFAEQADREDRLQMREQFGDVDHMTPIDYEQLCAELLRAKGWEVWETPATGDGGADLVAEKRPIRLIIQCKRYSKPVGNKAVQEVHSALTIHAGNCACVVAPNGFTPQAQREAKVHSVTLLNHGALQEFAEGVHRRGIAVRGRRVAGQ